MSEPHSLMPKRRKRCPKPKEKTVEENTAGPSWNFGHSNGEISTSRDEPVTSREKDEKLISPSSGWNDGKSFDRIDGPSRRKRNHAHSSSHYNNGGRSSPVESIVSVASSNRLVIDEDSQDIFDEDFSRYGFNNGESPKKQKGLGSEYFELTRGLLSGLNIHAVFLV